MEDTSKANIVFNISGGNNQILPNAIKAEYNPQNEMLPFHKTKCSETQNEASSL